jgi:single-stranded-DNA-specific exonuclease
MTNTPSGNITKRWEVYPCMPSEVSDRLIEYPPLIRQILYNRGIADVASAKRYFHALPPDETSPYLLKGMDKAVPRILSAIQNNERMVVYGDYDVDGVTATVLLVEALTKLGAIVIPYIPDRFDEGYGVNNDAMDKLKEQGCSLVISVDCGVRSMPEAEYSKQIGMDLIITDHHAPLEEIPNAFTVIDPKLPDDNYPCKELAGVGVAYKLAQALFTSTNRTMEMGELWIDLVALGTVADLAPLMNENRFLVRKGLEQIQKGSREGLVQLCRVAGIDYRKINSTNIGFGIGPRLNAAGRMETALAAFHLLVEKDVDQAGSFARALDEQNRARQVDTRTVVDKAMQIAEEEGLEKDIIIVTDENFSEGIVGLAASRLAEHYYRPAIVGKVGTEMTRCSCRSIPEFNITMALDECKDLMEHHGGHAAAAGFTIRSEKMTELKDRLYSIVKREFLDRELTPVLMADAEVNLSDLGQELYYNLLKFQPIGYSNPESLFITRGLRVQSIRDVGQDGKHLRLQLTDGWLSINAIAFNKGGMKNALMEKKKADFLFVFETNEYNGRVDFQLNVKDIHI